MRSIPRAAVPLAITVGLVAASPAAAADAGPSAKARASGSPAVELIYPSIVRARIARTRRALERATERYENGSLLDAVPTFKVVRRQLAASWRGAKYVIRTAPPPAPPEDLARLRRRARVAQDEGGPTYASPAETGFAVLTLQHDVAAEVVQLVDGSHGAGLNALSRTLFLALDRRDRAIQDIFTLAPPAPPEDLARVRVRARSSQEEDEVVTFDTVMPNTIAQFDDELQALAGTAADATDLTAGGRRLLGRASTQVTATKARVNTLWPPVPPED
jgi:hypothetical protein